MERNFLYLSPDKSVYISDTAELSSREAIKLSYWNDSIGSVWHLFSIVFFLCKFQTSIKTLSPLGSNFIQSKYRYTSNCLFWDVIFILLFCKTGNINKDSNSHPLNSDIVPLLIFLDRQTVDDRMAGTLTITA